MPSKVCFALLLGVSLPFFGQGNVDAPATRLAHAGTLYYAPAQHGLVGFRCDVQVDWVQVMKGSAVMSGHNPDDITPDFPVVTYFSHAHTTVDDSLLAANTVDTTDLPAVPPGFPSELLGKMGAAIHTSIRMAFDFWNPLNNGTLWNPTAPGVTVESQGDGLRVTNATPAAPITEELFDKDLLLTRFHAHLDGYDSPVTPEFSSTPGQPRQLTALHIAFSNPVSKATNDVTMRFTYASVQGYDLPASISTSLDGTTILKANLTGCTVKSSH